MTLEWRYFDMLYQIRDSRPRTVAHSSLPTKNRVDVRAAMNLRDEIRACHWL